MEYREILLDVFEDIKNNSEKTVYTGFKDIDMVLSGTKHGSLIIIGGRPSMGKTCLMTNILSNVLEKNHRCLYYTLEMSNKMFIERLLIQHAEIDYQRLRTNNMRKKDWEKLTQAMEESTNYDLHIKDSFGDIETLRKDIKEVEPEYVFIDYLQLINTCSKKTRSYELTKILSKLKTIAMENNIFIFITSQLSRAVECRCDKRPMLSDLRESGGIEEIADIVIFIYREEYYNYYFKENYDYAFNKGRAEIIIAKNKYGPLGTVDLLFRGATLKYSQPIKMDTF